MPKFGPCRYLSVEISKPWKVPFYMGYRRWRLARDGGSPGNYVNTMAVNALTPIHSRSCMHYPSIVGALDGPKRQSGYQSDWNF
jgi:hypothetical protein